MPKMPMIISICVAAEIVYLKLLSTPKSQLITNKTRFIEVELISLYIITTIYRNRFDLSHKIQS